MSTTQPSKPKRRCYRFSLRTLLLVMTVATVAFCGWVQLRRQRAQENRAREAAVEEALVAIEGIASDIACEYEDRSPTWLEEQFDDPGDADDPVGVRKVTELILHTDLDDTTAEHVGRLTHLKTLGLLGGNITDAGMKHLPALTNLQTLYLNFTNVTDAGLEPLKDLAQRKHLSVCNTQITDAGLEHLKELKGLAVLELSCIHVTSEGFNKLQPALPNCEIGPGPDQSLLKEGFFPDLFPLG